MLQFNDIFLEELVFMHFSPCPGRIVAAVACNAYAFCLIVVVYTADSNSI
jgi:hypothetical protein